ncbi:putative glucose n-acetyltransferase protein [Drechmeria coniospora]|uniref:Putative glucose n-acetyltransferase protein n=1 Tax=Drechmeria coniospora TaxID=98403 RepID=A0A151GGX0_DRECN|nr:putative glucose n-acetyltransferase protein [Drechmeria coniospora]KYK56312.1 putative glucose n-acetyltransferase protein [Drechmeria coniospora]
MTLRRTNASPLSGGQGLSLLTIACSRRFRLLTAAAAATGLFLWLLLNHTSPAKVPDWSALGWKAGSDNSPPDQIDHTIWSRFAYVQYVTNSAYLCNSVMIFETLHRLGSKADRVMMYPSNMMDPAATGASTPDGELLIKARDQYGVRLSPISVHHRDSEEGTWADSFTKLLAFNQTDYSRVLVLDSDAVVLQLMDELFLLPPCTAAMPRAYWLHPDKKILTSLLMLIEPNVVEFSRVMDKIESAGRNDYDMEIVNDLYIDSAMVLPHRRYAMLSAEFRSDGHALYLGSDREVWDPVAAYNEAKIIHFSDWPVAKPWLPTPAEVIQKYEPKCRMKDGLETCVERELWYRLYDDFRRYRREICPTGGDR